MDICLTSPPLTLLDLGREKSWNTSWRRVDLYHVRGSLQTAPYFGPCSSLPFLPTSVTTMSDTPTFPSSNTMPTCGDTMYQLNCRGEGEGKLKCSFPGNLLHRIYYYKLLFYYNFWTSKRTSLQRTTAEFILSLMCPFSKGFTCPDISGSAMNHCPITIISCCAHSSVCSAVECIMALKSLLWENELLR